MAKKILNAQQEELCNTSKWDFSDLKAVFINCTLKKSPEMSHTEGLIKISQAIMENNNVKWTAGCRFDHPNPEYR